MDNDINNYVNALYELGESEKKLQLYFENINLFADLLFQNPELANYFADRFVKFEVKHKLLHRMFPQKDAEYFRHWVYLLIQDNLIIHLPILLRNFIDRYNRNHNIITGTIWTTIKLNTQQITNFTRVIAKQLKTQVRLTNKLDTFLIAGVKIEVGDIVWDNSLRKQLNTLRENLLQKEK